NGKSKTSFIYSILEDDEASKENFAASETNKVNKKPGRKKLNESDYDIKPAVGDMMSGPVEGGGGGVAQEEFVVEKIVSRRYNQKRKQYEYLLKWEGYPPEQNTWEPARNMSTCQHLLAEFEAQLAARGAKGGSPPPQTPSPATHGGGTLSGPKKATGAIKQEAPDTPLATSSSRPVRSSKKKALDQVKVWCGSMLVKAEGGGGGGVLGELGGGGGLKRTLTDDSDYDEDDDDAFMSRLKRIKQQDPGDSDSSQDHAAVAAASLRKRPFGGAAAGRGGISRGGLGANSVVGRARAQMNGLKREEAASTLAAALGLQSEDEEDGGASAAVLVASAKGVVKVDPSQVPNLTSGVYIMSNKSGIVKLDSVTPNSAISSLQKKGLLKTTPSHKSGVIMLGSRMGPGATKSGIIRKAPLPPHSSPVGALRQVPRPPGLAAPPPTAARQTGVVPKSGLWPGVAYPLPLPATGLHAAVGHQAHRIHTGRCQPAKDAVAKEGC
ncbi:hypothetical protein LSTR_LSTR015710, partial [Laodelphax striatellus]